MLSLNQRLDAFRFAKYTCYVSAKTIYPLVEKSLPIKGGAKKPTLDEMGPGPAKESVPYRPASGPGGGPRPRSTAGKGGTRAWRGRKR